MRTKILLLSLSFLIMLCSTAMAVWSENFASIYYEKGIDAAVVSALEDGAAPKQIVKIALPLKDLKREVLMKALFCALAQPDTIREAAFANNIKEKKVNEGYQLALSECSRQMEENLNAALDSSNRFPGSTSSSNETRNTNYASPWKFK